MWDFLTCCALLVFFYKIFGRLIHQHEDDGGGEFEQVSQGQFMPWYDPDAVEDPDDE